jgi:hypothetical protein
MAIGEVKPQEEDNEDCELEETTILPPASNPGVFGEKFRDFGFSEKLRRKVRRFRTSC